MVNGVVTEVVVACACSKYKGDRGCGRGCNGQFVMVRRYLDLT